MQKATHEGNVAHAVDNDSLVLGRILSNTSKVGLDSMVSVQKWHLAVGLYPHLR
jgi:hypothetical protein